MAFETRRHWGVRAALTAIVVFFGSTPVARAESLERELLRQAPRVLKHLQTRGYMNVGVLKFRVKKGNEPITDRVGTLNLDLANRLEVALILADDFRQPVGVIHDASAKAAKIAGANHLVEAGRKRLFAARYPLAWGEEQVVPDAFLTGVAVLSPDLRTVTVGVVVFGREGGKLEKVVDFTADADPPALAAAGESFVLTRGLFDGGQVKTTKTVEAATTKAAETATTKAAETATTKAAETALKIKSGQSPNPVKNPEAPIALEIRYDDKPTPLEIKDGKALIREPKPGQVVTLVLRNRDTSPERYGVVLSVNGENTLFRQRGAALNAPKWVLGPQDPSVTIRGFQTGAKQAEAFRVLSPAESAKNAIDYGSDVGTITLVAFRESNTGVAPPSSSQDDEGEDLAAVTRGSFPSAPAKNLAALKSQLRSSGATETRGLVVGGRQIDASVRKVEFRANPTPVMAVTITYYKP